MHAFVACHWQCILRLDVGEPGQAAVAVLVFDAAGVCMLDGLVRAAAAVAVHHCEHCKNRDRVLTFSGFEVELARFVFEGKWRSSFRCTSPRSRE